MKNIFMKLFMRAGNVIDSSEEFNLWKALTKKIIFIVVTWYFLESYFIPDCKDFFKRVRSGDISIIVLLLLLAMFYLEQPQNYIWSLV